MDKTDAVMDLAKRRGFLYPAYEVYGGMAGFYDYGPLGSGMKHRFEELWRHVFVRQNAIPMAEVSCARVTMDTVLEASGHVAEFTDLVVRCANGHPSRADHLVEAAGYDGTADALSATQIDAEIKALGATCPTCKDRTFTAAAPLNLMNATEIGPGSGRTGYLRPETAQGIFTDFPHLLRFFRDRLPFGGVQVGGSNRNEISPRQGMLRLREFHMMEAEVFFEDTDAPLPAFEEIKERTATFVPNTDEQPATVSYADAVGSGMVCNQALAYFLAKTQEFLVLSGMDPDKLRFRQHLQTEMAHYASDCWDAEFHSDRYGWVECVGIADRGCYDLEQHATHSGKPATHPITGEAGMVPNADFMVRVPVEETTFEATRYTPNMGMLGRTFKAQAKAIAQALDDQFADAARTAGLRVRWPLGMDGFTVRAEDVRPQDGAITVQVGDEEVEIPTDCFEAEVGTWRVTEKRIIPRVIEPSFGVDRILYALWEHAYERGEKNGEPYTVMHLSKHVAPVQVAILPLTAKDGMPEAAHMIEHGLRNMGVETDYDQSGNIGRRYARQDEVGTPFCVTIDDQTQADGTVTVRDRDTTEQERVEIAQLPLWLQQHFALE